jgi:uncharacterized protein YcbK (DUF882 family)
MSPGPAHRSALLFAVAAVVSCPVALCGQARAEAVDPRLSNVTSPVTPAREPSTAAVTAPKTTRKPATRWGRRKRASTFSGYAPPAAILRKTPAPRPTGELKIFSLNLRETLEITSIYDGTGAIEPEAVQAVSRLLRDHRNGRIKPIEPKLVEVLSSVYERFGKRRLVLVSGFRSPKGSLNYHSRGAAADIKIEGVSARALRDYVRSLDSGGMGIGIYPHAGFVHVDVRPPPSYYWTDSSGATPRRRPAARHPAPRYEEAGAQ